MVPAPTPKPIKELIDELDLPAFWQTPGSKLINVKAIASVTRYFRGRHVHGHGGKLEVSRSYSHLFKGI